MTKKREKEIVLGHEEEMALGLGCFKTPCVLACDKPIVHTHSAPVQTLSKMQ